VDDRVGGAKERDEVVIRDVGPSPLGLRQVEVRKAPRDAEDRLDRRVGGERGEKTRPDVAGRSHDDDSHLELITRERGTKRGSDRSSFGSCPARLSVPRRARRLATASSSDRLADDDLLRVQDEAPTTEEAQVAVAGFTREELEAIHERAMSHALDEADASLRAALQAFGEAAANLADKLPGAEVQDPFEHPI
jgi:hypothetical protein